MAQNCLYDIVAYCWQAYKGDADSHKFTSRRSKHRLFKFLYSYFKNAIIKLRYSSVGGRWSRKLSIYVCL